MGVIRTSLLCVFTTALMFGTNNSSSVSATEVVVDVPESNVVMNVDAPIFDDFVITNSCWDCGQEIPTSH